MEDLFTVLLVNVGFLFLLIVVYIQKRISKINLEKEFNAFRNVTRGHIKRLEEKIKELTGKE